MNYKKAIISILTISVIFSTNCITIYPYSTSPATENSLSKDLIFDPENLLQLNAASAILIDAKTGIILYEKNANERLYPASITKIMTAILAIEYGGFDETVTHSHEAVYGIGYGSSHIGMREGEQIILDDALLGIMLASANEVSVAVAEHIDGTKENFAEHMTRRAKQLGALDTNFTNPHGFHDTNHYTTAYDMAMIMKYAVDNEKFIDIISTKTHTIMPTNIVDEERIINNSHRMIRAHSTYYYDDVVGGKTGFTNEAGRTLVTYAKRGDISLISVVMKAENNAAYEDTTKMLDYGFDIYEPKRLFLASEYSNVLDVIQNYGDRVISLGNVNVVPKSNLSELLPYFVTKDNTDKIISIAEYVEAPVHYGSVVGSIEFKYKDASIAVIPLISKNAVQAMDADALMKEERLLDLKEKLGIVVTVGMVIVGVAFCGLIFILFRNKALSKKNMYKKVRLPKRINFKQKE